MNDCRYCAYAVCKDKNSKHVDCYVNEGSRFDHHVEDPHEAEYCDNFDYSSKFPKD